MGSKLEIKGKFYELKKELTVYRNNDGVLNNSVRIFTYSEEAKEYARKTILDELFYYEDMPEDWEMMEERLGKTRQEMIKMPFELFLIVVKDYFIVVIEHWAEEYVPGAGMGGALPYSD